jgi:tetratricopeptide (TPR) repeat protein
VVAALVALALLQAPAQRASQALDAGVKFVNRGQFAQAAEKFAEALTLDPSLAEAHYLMGLIRQQSGRPDAALDSFRAALKAHPRYAAAQARVCEIEARASLNRESGYGEALAGCQRAARLDAKDAESRFHAGSLEARMGRHAAAAQSFAAVLRLDPVYGNARYELAMALMESGNAVRGIALLREVVAAEPGHGNARFQLGSALVKQGDCAEALPHLEAATEAPQKYYLLSGCYRKLGREDDASQSMARVKQLREGAEARMRAKFRAAVGRQKAEEGALEEAITEYRAAYDLAPDVTLAVDLAVVMLRKGDTAGVIELLGRYREPLARYQVGLAHAMAGRHGDATPVLRGVVRDDPRFGEAWYQLGVALLAAGDAEAGERALARAVELRPDDPAMRRGWAEALAARGLDKEAAAQRAVAKRLE